MAHVCTDPPEPEYAFPWPKILGGERGRLGYLPHPTTWEPRHTFDSLGAAREKAQRMADVICPREQVRRDHNA